MGSALREKKSDTKQEDAFMASSGGKDGEIRRKGSDSRMPDAEGGKGNTKSKKTFAKKQKGSNIRKNVEVGVAREGQKQTTLAAVKGTFERDRIGTEKKQKGKEIHIGSRCK